MVVAQFPLGFRGGAVLLRILHLLFFWFDYGQFSAGGIFLPLFSVIGLRFGADARGDHLFQLLQLRDRDFLEDKKRLSVVELCVGLPCSRLPSSVLVYSRAPLGTGSPEQWWRGMDLLWGIGVVVQKCGDVFFLDWWRRECCSVREMHEKFQFPIPRDAREFEFQAIPRRKTDEEKHNNLYLKRLRVDEV